VHSSRGLIFLHSHTGRGIPWPVVLLVWTTYRLGVIGLEDLGKN
jgi:hypothetical protein